MANSKITITFGADALDLGQVTFRYFKLSDPSVNTQIGETFFDIGRQSNYMIPTATTDIPPYTIIGEATAYNFAFYFALDYGSIVTVNQILNVVTIEMKSADWGIDNATNTIGGLTYVIESLIAPTFELTSVVEVAKVGDVCNTIIAQITATENIHEYVLNRVTVPVTPNVYQEIELIRGITNTIDIIDSLGYRIFAGSFFYDTLTSEKINVGVTQSLTGATLNVTVNDTDSLTLQYSLDGVVYQSSEIFTGQANGENLTMYVKDEFGCIKTKSYKIDAFGTREAYLKISDSNSVGFKEQVDTNELTVFRNDNNSLSHQELPDVKYCSLNRFMTGDITTIQIKTNFTTIIPTLRKDDLSEVVLDISKMSNNLNRFMRMDAKYYLYDSLHTGIYFEDGNTYDEFDSVLESYTLGGNLPDFAVKGNQITILGGLGTFNIKDIVYDRTLKKKAILIELVYPGTGVESIKVESIYDLLQFEVYEFDVNWSDHGEGIYDLMIENTHDDYGTVIHLSENIEIKDLHAGTFAIRYFNNDQSNRDIFYKYGIEHLIRVPVLHKRAVPNDVNEINITDDNTTLVTSDVKELNEFQFDSVSESRMRQIVLALSCENVYIQDIGYLKFDSVGYENEDNTNGYLVTATMIKTGVNFSINRDGDDESDVFTDDIFDIPQFLGDGTGHIKT